MCETIAAEGAMRIEPVFTCLSRGAKFAESPSSTYRCSDCFRGDQRQKTLAVERRPGRDDAGLKRMLANAGR
jgi:hypothetical protein